TPTNPTTSFVAGRRLQRIILLNGRLSAVSSKVTISLLRSPNTTLYFTASVSPCRTLSVLLGSTPFQNRMTYPSSSYLEGLIRTMRNFLNRGCGVGSVFDVCSLVSGLNIFFCYPALAAAAPSAVC